MAVRERIIAWEFGINRQFPDLPFIGVRNKVDGEGPPNDFSYIRENVCYFSNQGSGTPFFGCVCEDCNLAPKDCCASLSGHRDSYNSSGLLTLEPGDVIFECNDSCACDKNTCHNRVVQKGPTAPMEIFKTSNGRGWGLKTHRDLKKGQFVLEYVGEILQREEADRRQIFQHYENYTYLFSLDFDDQESPYVLDSAEYGNVARFINHSCEANLEAYPVFVNQSNRLQPRLALFAKKDIPKLQELNLDYKMNNRNSRKGDNGKETQSKPKIVCQCGAKKCRKYLY